MIETMVPSKSKREPRAKKSRNKILAPIAASAAVIKIFPRSLPACRYVGSISAKVAMLAVIRNPQMKMGSLPPCRSFLKTRPRIMRDGISIAIRPIFATIAISPAALLMEKLAATT